MSQTDDSTRVFDETQLLSLIYEVNFTVDLGIYDEFETWLQEHLQSTIKTCSGFRDAEVFERDPKNDEGDMTLSNPDRVHRYITVLFEVEKKDHIENYLRDEAPKVKAQLQERFNQKDALVITSRRILYPMSLWAKRMTFGGSR